ANGSPTPLKLFFARIPGYPARLDMQLGNTTVIPPEERQEVLSKIVFIMLGQRSHDPEIKRDIAPQGFRCVRHIDIAGVHVGVKKPVCKDLHEKDLRSEEHTSE